MKYCYMLQYGRTLKPEFWIKEARYNWSLTALLHLYKIFRIRKSIEIESTVEVAQDMGEGWMSSDCKWVQLSYLGDENVQQLVNCNCTMLWVLDNTKNAYLQWILYMRIKSQ